MGYRSCMPVPVSPLPLENADLRQVRQWLSAFGTPQQVVLRCHALEKRGNPVVQLYSGHYTRLRKARARLVPLVLRDSRVMKLTWQAAHLI